MLAILSSSTALALSLFLLIVGKSGRGLPGCAANSGCGTLSKGRWSRWLGIPTAALAIPVYLAVLICLLAGQGRVPHQQQALQVLAIWMAGSAVWFTALQMGIRRYCLYCMLIHACGLVSAVSILSSNPIWPASSHLASITIGMAGLAMLIGGQLLLPGKTYAVESSGPRCAREEKGEEEKVEGREGPQAKVCSVAESRARPLTHRKISLLSGKIVLEMDAWPILGDPSARQVVACLFDYTCDECHHLHGLLHQALAARKTSLAVMLLPLPQNSQCNSLIKRDTVEHALACAYARVGLALWAAGPEAFQHWHEFLLSEPVIQPYGLALLRAQKLADLSRYNFKEPSEAFGAQIKAAVEIYQRGGIQSLPALLLPSAALRGHLPNLAALLKIVDGQFGQAPQITVLR